MRSVARGVRVLMIGPGEGAIGGISTLAETLVPVLKEQVDLLYLPTVQERPAKESGKVSVRNIALAISQYTRFLRALHHFHPDIIHLHTSQGIAWLKDTFFIFISKIYRRRVVLHMHGGNFDELYNKSSYLFKCYTRRVIRLVDAVIAVSVEWERRLSQIVPIDRTHVFRNCIAVTAIGPCFAHHSTDGVKALFLGVVGPSKGAFDLLEAMNHLRSGGCSLHLWLAGNEEREGDLARARIRLQELHLENMCQLLGTVRGVKKAELLREASLFALPSYQECLPMALLEALAAGMAIVATPVGGIPEVVKDSYNGFLVNPGDVEALAEKLAILANDQRLREAMGRRSREIAEQELDVNPYAKRLVELYESLVAPQKA